MYKASKSVLFHNDPSINKIVLYETNIQAKLIFEIKIIQTSIPNPLVISHFLNLHCKTDVGTNDFVTGKRPRPTYHH